jgi:hypothetical protein
MPKSVRRELKFPDWYESSTCDRIFAAERIVEWDNPEMHLRAREDPIMEPKTSNIGTTGAGQKEGQSLSPDTTATSAATKTGNRAANQNLPSSGKGDKQDQTAGYGRNKND